MSDFLRTLGNVIIALTLFTAVYAWFQGRTEWTPALVLAAIVGIGLLNIGKPMQRRG